MNGKKRAALALALVLLGVVAAALLVLGGAQRAENAFAQPLFEYPLPEDARLVTRDAGASGRDTIAALLLASDRTQAQLEAHYANFTCPPAHEGETVTLEVYPANDATLETLQKAGEYREGETYWFIYVTSAAP